MAIRGFSGDTGLKQSVCQSGDARDEGSIPGFSPGAGNGNPLQYFCLENSTNRGTWQATVHETAESDTTQ